MKLYWTKSRITNTLIKNVITKLLHFINIIYFLS